MSQKINEPLISIIIPVYNSGAHLAESMRSVMNQSYRNLEIICVDDGSQDKSRDILEELSQSDARIKIISQDNQGAGAARNTGMDAAVGEYIYFFDSDDILRKNAIGLLVKTAVKYDTEIVLFGYHKFDGRRKYRVAYSPKVLRVPLKHVISPEDISNVLFQADHGMPWNKFYRSDFLRSSNVRFQALMNTNDEYFSRMTTATASRILFLNKDLTGYRVGNKNSLRGNADKNILDCTRALYAICDDLKSKQIFDRYSDTFRKLAGYVIMLKLKAVQDPDAFRVLALEIADTTADKCEMKEEYLEECYKGAYRALLSKDLTLLRSELDRIK